MLAFIVKHQLVLRSGRAVAADLLIGRRARFALSQNGSPVRLPSLIAISGLLLAGVGFFGKPLSERLADTDVSALLDKVQEQIHDARQAFDQDRKALEEARAGVACLNGSGPCPGNQHPFPR